MMLKLYVEQEKIPALLAFGIFWPMLKLRCLCNVPGVDAFACQVSIRRKFLALAKTKVAMQCLRYGCFFMPSFNKIGPLVGP